MLLHATEVLWSLHGIIMVIADTASVSLRIKEVCQHVQDLALCRDRDRLSLNVSYYCYNLIAL